MLREIRDVLKQVIEGQRQSDKELKRLIATVSGLTEMSVRQSVGNPVPNEYQAALIGSLPSLLVQLAYLRHVGQAVIHIFRQCEKLGQEVSQDQLREAK